MTTKNYQLPPLCNIPIEIQEKAQKDGISPIHTNLNKSVDLNNPSFRAIFVKDQIWTRDGYVNIDFVSGSAWSYVGRTSYHDSTSVTTMNLGFMYMPTTSFTVDGKTFEPSLWLNDPDMRVTDEFKGVVVMHEFGHTCGMMHEHQNGLEGKPIDINYDVLYSRNNGIFEYDCPNTSCKCDRGNNPQPPNTPDCSCSPGGCNCSCEANYFQRMYGNVGNVYSGSAFEGSDFDNKSVMLYGLPNQVIVGCENVPNGQYCANNPTYQRSTGYSPTDKEFLDNFYDSNNTPTITVTFKSGPEWKQYWVKKVLQDYLNPIVGIRRKRSKKTLSINQL